MRNSFCRLRHFELCQSQDHYTDYVVLQCETRFKTPLYNRPSVIYIFTGLEKVTGLAYFLPLGLFLSCVFLMKANLKVTGKAKLKLGRNKVNYSPGTGEAKLSLGKLN